MRNNSRFVFVLSMFIVLMLAGSSLLVSALTPQVRAALASQEPKLTSMSSYELTNYLVDNECSFEYSKDGGTTWTTQPAGGAGTGIAFGDRIRVRLGWAFPNAMSINAGDSFTYTLPNSEDSVINYLHTTGNVMNGSTVDGTFEIDGTQLVIRYTSDEGSNVHGNISFEGDLQGTTEERTQGSTKKIIFPGSVTDLNLDIAPVASAVDVSKRYTHSDPSSDIWRYVIKVTTSGKNENLTLTDHMGNLIALGATGVQVSSDEAGTVPVSGATVTGGDAGSRDITVTIPSTQDGQTYYISYDAKANPELVGLAYANKKYDQIKNQVGVTSNQITTPQTTEQTLVEENPWNVEKSGVADTDAKTIAWTIVIDAGDIGDLSGSRISDSLGANLQAPSSVSLEESSDGVTWHVSATGITWEALANGTASLPANAKGKKIRITYTTAYTDESVYGGTYENTFTVVPHDNTDYTMTKTERVVVGNVDTKGEVEKRVLSTDLTSTPQWLSTIHAETDLTGVKFYDYTDGKHTINADSVEVFTDEECTTPYTGSYDSGLFHGRLMVAFKDTISAGTTLYIRYTTTLLGSSVDMSGDTAIVNVTNTSELAYDGLISSKTATATYTQATHLTKGYVTDHKADGGSFMWALGLGVLPSNASSVTIVDTLPANQSFQSGTVKAVDNPTDPTAFYDGVSTTDNGNGTVTFTVTGTALRMAKEGKINIVFSSQWKDISTVVAGTVENRAQLTLDGNVEPSVSAFTFGKPPTVLTKEYAYNTTTAPRATYTIKVNPSGIALNGGRTLTLEDTIGSALEFVLGSVKIDGVPIADLADKGYSYAFDTEERKISIMMPDSTPATVTYEAHVKLKPGDTLDSTNAVNDVKLICETSTPSESSTTINAVVLEPLATTSSDYNKLIIYKHREGSVTTALTGARFRIEQLTLAKSENNWTTTSSTEIGTVTSGSNGYTPTVDRLLSDTIYRIIETDPPAGYAASEPIYIVFPGADNINYSHVLVDQKPVQVFEGVQTGIAYVADEPSTQYARVSLNATKSITGRPFCANDSFTFDVSAMTSGAPVPKDDGGAQMSSRTIKPGSGTSCNVDLGTITFSTDDLGGADSKEFVYSVAERAGSAGGMLYDTTPRQVTVTLSRATDGSLSTNVSYSRGSEAVSGLLFQNEYSSVGINVSANISKTLAGRPLRGGEFAFILTPYGKTTPVVGYGENAADGTITLTHPLTDQVGRTYDLDSLSDVECNADGSRSKTFAYTVTEVTGVLSAEQLASLSEAQRNNLAGKTILPAGMSSTVSSQSFTINVSDDGQGHMSAVCSCGATMTPVGGTSTTTGTPLELKNSYRPASTTISLTGNKDLCADSGLTPPSIASVAGKFGFTISSDDPTAPLPDVTTVTNAADGSVSFGDITFAASDIASVEWSGGVRSRDFIYTIREANAPSGFEKDTDKTVKVRLTDDGNGQLSATVVEPIAAPNFPFQNKYVPQPAEARIEVTKEVTTAEGIPDLKMDSGDFTFVLTAGDSATPMPEGVSGGTATADNLGSGDKADTALFGAITYDTPGTYSYTLTEQQTNKATGQPLPGFIYDTASYDVTVTVIDDGTGQLTANVTYKSGDTVVSKPVFTNSYSPADANVSLSGLKKIIGVGNAAATDEPTIQKLIDAGYTFTLSGEAGSPMPSSATGSTATASFTPSTSSDNLTGLVDFGSITFRPSDMAGAQLMNGSMVKDFTYTITEHEPDDSSKIIPGLTGNATARVTIRVTDDLSGALSAEVVKASAEGSDFVISDVYNGAYVVLSGTKTMTGRPFRNGDEFSFRIEPLTVDAPRLVNVQGEPHDSLTVRPVSGTSVLLDFGAAVFTGSDLEENGTREFVYRFSENAGSIAGVSYDPKQVYAKVTLVRTADSFTASAAYYSDEGCTQQIDSLAFQNTYSAGSVSVSLGANKEIVTEGNLVPPTPRAGDYSMTLTAGDGNTPMPAGTRGGALTKAIDDQKHVDFGSITYDAAGTYTYTITEVAGSVPGMSYDSTQHTARVEVTDVGSGTLSARVVYDDNIAALAPTFTNTYTATPASISFNAAKVLQKRTLRAGEFSFTLRSAEEGLIQTATNDAAGTVSFDALEFDRPGTYTYTIAEVQDARDYIDFDSTRHTAVVTVADDSRGALHASVVYDGDESVTSPTFTNTYHPEDAVVILEGSKSYNGESSAGFSFYVEGPGKNESGELVAAAIVSEGVTNFNGNLTMSPISYSLDDLIAMRNAGYATFTEGEQADTYTVYYYVFEDGVFTDLPARGIQPVRDAQLITVNISDDGSVLTPQVDYGDYGRLSFVNILSPTSPQLSLLGNKTIVSTTAAEEGTPTLKDIAGAFEFTISCDDSDAPMPMLDGEVIDTVSSDVNGQIAFYPMTFDVGLLDGVPWEGGQRKRSFTYTIREKLGSGLTEDQVRATKYMSCDEDKTVTVTVTSDTSGALNAVVEADTGNDEMAKMPDFTFTNTWNPSTPSEPDNPSEPSNPDSPSKPENPGNPDNPSNPDSSSDSDNPSNPDNPESPSDSDNSTTQPTSSTTDNNSGVQSNETSNAGKTDAQTSWPSHGNSGFAASASSAAKVPKAGDSLAGAHGAVYGLLVFTGIAALVVFTVLRRIRKQRR